MLIAQQHIEKLENIFSQVFDFWPFKVQEEAEVETAYSVKVGKDWELTNNALKAKNYSNTNIHNPKFTRIGEW